MPGFGELLVIAAVVFAAGFLRGPVGASEAASRSATEQVQWWLYRAVRSRLPAWVPLPAVRQPMPQQDLRKVVDDVVQGRAARRPAGDQDPGGS
jgi:hypothetical protein